MFHLRLRSISVSVFFGCHSLFSLSVRVCLSLHLLHASFCALFLLSVFSLSARSLSLSLPLSLSLSLLSFFSLFSSLFSSLFLSISFLSLSFLSLSSLLRCFSPFFLFSLLRCFSRSSSPFLHLSSVLHLRIFSQLYIEVYCKQTFQGESSTRSLKAPLKVPPKGPLRPPLKAPLKAPLRVPPKAPLMVSLEAPLEVSPPRPSQATVATSSVGSEDPLQACTRLPCRCSSA